MNYPYCGEKTRRGLQCLWDRQEDGTNGSKTTTTEKQVAPDTAAAIFWLKNRQPDIWRDKKEMVVEENNLTPWSDLEAGVDE